MNRYRILYRGPLSSCNFSCSYCPFSKTPCSADELRLDSAALGRFTEWTLSQDSQLGIFFTPWGEALIHPHYQKAISSLSNASNVFRVAIQSNLSCDLSWLSECCRKTVAFWISYHPDEMALTELLSKCRFLMEEEFSFSVGVVGVKQNFDAIKNLRTEMPKSIYLWINVYKSPGYYDQGEIAYLQSIDPLFGYNLRPHASRKRDCRTGHSVFSVNGDGDIRRCYFVDEVLGNIYSQDWEQALRKRPCPNEECRCHIGYVHLEHLGMDGIFGEGIFERVPRDDSGA